MLKNVLDQGTNERDLEDERILRAWLDESKGKLKDDTGSTFNPSFFNPNLIDQDKWVALGFKKNIAKRIIKYRASGGSFNKREDLLKIYGINKKLATAYFDYMIIPQPAPKPKTSTLKETVEKMVIEKETAKFDLNLADSSQLQIVRGIGPILSSRIIKYREMLGGFTSAEQLREVYGIKEEVYQRALSHFGVLVSSARKININEDSINVLAKHPYLSFKVSRAIVKYRAQHGDYSSVEELKKIHIISDSVYHKIIPYLKAETQN